MVHPCQPARSASNERNQSRFVLFCGVRWQTHRGGSRVFSTWICDGSPTLAHSVEVKSISRIAAEVDALKIPPGAQFLYFLSGTADRTHAPYIYVSGNGRYRSIKHVSSSGCELLSPRSKPWNIYTNRNTKPRMTVASRTVHRPNA